MKFIQTFRVLALVALLAITAAAQEKPAQPSGMPASGAPKLVIESYTHDFGEVKSGEPLRYAFKVKNEGNADLVINNVAPG